jgi:F0F1-type ATP synthase membrane subunit b/b'
LSDYGPPVPCSWGDWVAADYARKLERERDEARELHINTLREREATEKKVDAMLELAQKAERERDKAREQTKELIYIAERAIALAEIDFENDKFGVVSELRDGVERIKVGAK